MRARTTTLLAVAFVAIFVGATSVATAKPLPKLANGYMFAVKPKTVYGWTGDGSQILGGASDNLPTGYEPNGSFGKIEWRTWRRRRAFGQGVLWRNDCEPSCGGGTWHGEPTRVTVFRVRRGHFTRMRFACICLGPGAPRVLFGFRGLLPPEWRILRRWSSGGP